MPRFPTSLPRTEDEKDEFAIKIADLVRESIVSSLNIERDTEGYVTVTLEFIVCPRRDKK